MSCRKLNEVKKRSTVRPVLDKGSKEMSKLSKDKQNNYERYGIHG